MDPEHTNTPTGRPNNHYTPYNMPRINVTLMRSRPPLWQGYAVIELASRILAT